MTCFLIHIRYYPRRLSGPPVTTVMPGTSCVLHKRGSLREVGTQPVLCLSCTPGVWRGREWHLFVIDAPRMKRLGVIHTFVLAAACGLPTYWHAFLVTCVLASPTSRKLQDIRDFCPFCIPLCPQYHELYLTHSRCSKNICGMNTWA